MEPVSSDNFLFSFDYEASTEKDTVKNILFFHSTKMEQSQSALERLMEIFPEAHFYIIKKPEAAFCNLDEKRITVFLTPGKLISPEFRFGNGNMQNILRSIDRVFFGVNMNLSITGDLVGFKTNYTNILECLDNFKLKTRTFIFDYGFRVSPFHKLDIESWTANWRVKGHDLLLPWTLLSITEKEKLYDLAHSGPEDGAIINIGHFFGGSSIILAKGSKEADREKIFSFDIKEHKLGQDLPEKNRVKDWIHFQEKSSEEGAREWGKRADTRVRLLFIDGDHSYEGCKRDILCWVPYLVPGGIIAVHDYCNVSEGTNFGMLVKAVFDTVLKSNQFEGFFKENTLFIARKK